MIRIGALLVLLFVAPARAEPTAGFAPGVAAAVYAAALNFMVPRTLEPVPVSQLTLWGLHGLTALDPLLNTERQDGRLLLASAGRLLTQIAAPGNEDPDSWASAAAELSTVAAAESAAVRRAGTRGVVQSFFDELFNHLDPYSRYIPPQAAGQDIEHREGEAGAGLTLARVMVPRLGRAIVVQDVIEDGPGAVAGIRPGDVVLFVDQRATRHKNAETVAGWIAGPEDTDVLITVRGRDGRVRSATVRRALVPPETVFAERADNLLLLQVTGFSQSTDKHLALAIEQGLAATRPPRIVPHGIVPHGIVPRGIVIDLRGNRGGLLRQAVATANELLPAGIVAITTGRDPAASRIWRSGSGELATDVPVVVLVDGRSASAAEILAAALADRGRAVVAGSVTLGKGLVQVIDPLPDGGELFLTWSRVLAPRGWPIQGLGVLPQVCTSLGQEALRRQLLALADGSQPMDAAIAASRAARAPLPLAEIIMIRSACPAAEGGDTDLDAARFLIEHPAAYAAALLPPMR